MTLPNWIHYVSMTDSFETDLKPCKCERCAYEWYPRIDVNGYLSLKMCPKCKSKLWNKSKT